MTRASGRRWLLLFAVFIAGGLFDTLGWLAVFGWQYWPHNLMAVLWRAVGALVVAGLLAWAVRQLRAVRA